MAFAPGIMTAQARRQSQLMQAMFRRSGPARSNSMRIGLIVLLLTVPPYQILAEGAEEYLRRQGEKNHHKEQANSLVRHDREDTGIQHRTND